MSHHEHDARLIRHAARLVAACVLLAGLAACGSGGRVTAVAATTPDPSGKRRALLAGLAELVVPSSSGGWVAIAPGEQAVLDVWLRAAWLTGRASAYASARDAVEAQWRLHPEDRALALALAETLPGPGNGTEQPSELASDLLQRAVDGLARHDPDWLGPLLSLSVGTSSAGRRAGREIVERAGSPGCDALPGPEAALPDPSGALTVMVRALVVEGKRCAAASSLLERALASPRWRSWVAANELTDLALLSPRRSASIRRALHAQFDRWVDPSAEAPIDLGASVAVSRSRLRLGLGDRLPDRLVAHVEGQVRHRGSLAGRSTSPPTPYDVAALRLLAGARLVRPGALTETIDAERRFADRRGDAGVVHRLLVEGEVPSCAERPLTGDRPPGRVTIDGLVAEQVVKVVAARCRTGLDLAALVTSARRDRGGDRAVVRIAATIVAACLLRPDPLTRRELRAARAPVSVGQSFASDPIVLWARAIALDPVAACRATRSS